MSNGELRDLDHVADIETLAMDEFVVLTDPPRPSLTAAWLMGRTFNELAHRLQAARLISRQLNSQRTDELWEFLSSIVPDLANQEERHDAIGRIGQCRNDWLATDQSEWWSDQVVGANQELRAWQDRGIEIPDHQDETGLLLSLAQSSNTDIDPLRHECVALCRNADVVNAFELGCLADQLVHRPIIRETFLWQHTTLPLTASEMSDVPRESGQLQDNSWLVTPQSPTPDWRLPAELPLLNPNWPSNAWHKRLHGELSRVIRNPSVASAVLSQTDCPMIIAIERMVIGNDAHLRDDTGDDSNAPEETEGGGHEAYLGIEIEGTRVSRHGYESIELSSRLHLAILRAFVQRRVRLHTISELTDNWESWGGRAKPIPNGVTSEFNRLNNSLRPCQVRILSVGRNIGWRLVSTVNSG